jgi:hypothetical protein
VLVESQDHNRVEMVKPFMGNQVDLQ